MRQPVTGRRVVITGAARGIGAATAAELARRGARLGLVGLEPELLAQRASELPGDHAWAEADVTNQQQLDAAIVAVVEQLGRVDIVLANAGIGNAGTVRTVDPETFARTIDVNLVGVYRTVAATVGALADSRGYLLLVASLASFVPMPGGAAYGASKAGVESLAASLRLELAATGVTVGSAHPSWVDTDIVRGPERDYPTFAKLRRQLPWPAHATMSVEQCAGMLADAMERRAVRVYIPRGVALASYLRPLTMSGRLYLAIGRRLGKDLPALDAENQALGATWR